MFPKVPQSSLGILKTMVEIIPNHLKETCLMVELSTPVIQHSWLENGGPGLKMHFR